MLMLPRSIVARLGCLAAVSAIVVSCSGSAADLSPAGPSAPTSRDARISEDSPLTDPVPPDLPPEETVPGTGDEQAAAVPGAPPDASLNPDVAAPVAPVAPDPGAPVPAPAPGVPFDPNRPVPGPSTFSLLLSVRVDPLPVPFSGRPIELFSCRDLANTWYYTHLLNTETGLAVTITERENFFDGNWVSTTKATIVIEGNSGARIESRWCSAFPWAHTAQHRYKGIDANGNPVTIMGPVIQLLAAPNAPPRPIALN